MGYMVDSVDDNTSIITVEGSVDENLEQVANNVLNVDKTPNIILDLEGSRPLLGDHIELAVKIHHKCTDYHGTLKLCHLARETKYVMEIMNLDQFFYIFPTVKDALATSIEPEKAPADEVPEEEILDDKVQEEVLLKEIDLDSTNLVPPVKPKEPVERRIQIEDEPGRNLPKSLPKTLGKRKPARRILPQSKEGALSLKEREERVEQFVHYVAKTMVHLKVFEFLVKHKEMKNFSLAVLVQKIDEPEEAIQDVLDHLEKLRIISQSGVIYQYSPGPKAVQDIQEFLRMWNHPKNHSRILSWVFAEEKVYMEAKKQLNQDASKQKGGWKKWFSKETTPATEKKKIQKKNALLDEEDEDDDVDAILSKAGNATPLSSGGDGLMTLDLGGDDFVPADELDPELLLQNFPKTPANLSKFMSRAALHTQHGNLDKAVNDYNVILDLNPDHLKARLKRGELYDKQEKFRLSVQDYSYILRKEPKNFSAIRNRSEAFYRLLSYDQALRDCETLIKAGVFKFDAYATRGKCNQNLGHYVKAVADLSQALKVKPHWVKGLIYRGKALQHLKKYKEALADFERAYKLNPKYGELKKLITEVSKKV